MRASHACMLPCRVSAAHLSSQHRPLSHPKHNAHASPMQDGIATCNSTQPSQWSFEPARTMTAYLAAARVAAAALGVVSVAPAACAPPSASAAAATAAPAALGLRPRLAGAAAASCPAVAAVLDASAAAVAGAASSSTATAPSSPSPSDFGLRPRLAATSTAMRGAGIRRGRPRWPCLHGNANPTPLSGLAPRLSAYMT